MKSFKDNYIKDASNSEKIELFDDDMIKLPSLGSPFVFWTIAYCQKYSD